MVCLSTLGLLALTTLATAAQQPAASIDVPAGARAMLQAKGEGVQIYACTVTGGAAKWTLLGPDAKLLDPAGKQIGTHFAGPTWKLEDGSQVQGQLIASQPSPYAGSVAWLLLRAKPGSPTGQLTAVAYIRRTETHGGAPGAASCQSPSDSGKTARVPYSATYTFYAAQ
jgi:hypothetical protein